MLVLDKSAKRLISAPYTLFSKWGAWMIDVPGVEGRLSVAEARELARTLNTAANVAYTRELVGICPRCSRETCKRQHEGAILQMYGRGPHYRHEGTTKGGRVRLRNLDTGKLKYTKSVFCWHWVRDDPEWSA